MVTYTLTEKQLKDLLAKALAAQKAKPTVVANTGKSAKSLASLANEKAAKIAFKKAGFGDVTPHVDVMTFNRWIAAGFRPMEGSKSLKVKNLRLFHKTQVRGLTVEEKAAMVKQSEDAMARHEVENNVTNIADRQPSVVE